MGLRVFGFVNTFVYDHIRKETLIKKMVEYQFQSRYRLWGTW